MDYRNQTSLPVGIRNNNPGNIKYDQAVNWQGASGNDGTFVIFADDTWGLRALATDLGNKISKDGLDTITAIISDYAPPVENNTAAYIAAVSSDTGLGADDPITPDGTTIHGLIRAIVNHENGDGPSAQYISDADIDQGISMVNAGLAQLFRQG